MLQDVEHAGSFVFGHRWESIEAHKAALPQLPREPLAKLMDIVAGMPDGRYLSVAGEG